MRPSRRHRASVVRSIPINFAACCGDSNCCASIDILLPHTLLITQQLRHLP
nr:MAG TPA: arsenical resistance operon trans-acting repressor [Bacteriophage sp.]